MEQKSLRSQLHTLVGNEMRLGKRSNMYGGVSHHVEAHEKAENELEKFLEENPSMMECVEDVEEHFRKNF
jgi:hypothetical protein